MSKGKRIVSAVVVPAARKNELINLLDATGHPKTEGLVTKIPGEETVYQVDVGRIELEIRPTVLFLIDCGASKKGGKKNE